MDIHKNAVSRRIVELIWCAALVEGQSKTKVAAAFGVCRAGKWVARSAAQAAFVIAPSQKAAVAQIETPRRAEPASGLPGGRRVVSHR